MTCGERKKTVKVGLRDWGGRPFWGSRTTADYARLGVVRATLGFPLKPGTNALIAQNQTIHLALNGLGHYPSNRLKNNRIKSW